MTKVTRIIKSHKSSETDPSEFSNRKMKATNLKFLDLIS